MSFQKILETTVNLPIAGILKVTGAVQMSLTGASPYRYSFNLLIDGQLVWNPGGALNQDSIPLVGVAYCQPGNRTVTLLWTADPSLTLVRAFMLIEGMHNVAGIN